MDLTTISSAVNISADYSSPAYNPDVLEIHKKDGDVVNTNNIYHAITEPPEIVNATKDFDDIPQWKKILNKVFTINMAVVLVVLMLGMGSHVYVKEVIGNFWPPLPILIGMCGQFVVLPSLAFGISNLFKMEPYVALGCLIVSCSPGGTFSNFFTYWVHGDVALSLVMTTCSTLLSFGAMPLNLWIYSSNIVGADSKRIAVPYKNIVTTLGFVVGPAIVGMIIRHYSERIAIKTTKVASILGYLIVIMNTICTFILFWEMLISASWLIHVSVLILPVCGLSLAYLVAYLSGRTHKICRTIAIETASQNMPVAIGVVVLSFHEIEIRTKTLLYPILYGLYMFSEICIGAALFRWYYYRKEKNKQRPDTENTQLCDVKNENTCNVLEMNSGTDA